MGSGWNGTENQNQVSPWPNIFHYPGCKKSDVLEGPIDCKRGVVVLSLLPIAVCLVHTHSLTLRLWLWNWVVNMPVQGNYYLVIFKEVFNPTHMRVLINVNATPKWVQIVKYPNPPKLWSSYMSIFRGIICILHFSNIDLKIASLRIGETSRKKLHR